jgi:hypothetical protein
MTRCHLDGAETQDSTGVRMLHPEIENENN